MSGQPADLIALADFWIAHDGVHLGIIGNARHCRGYHLGSDRIYGSCACRPDGDCVAGLRDNDYSVKTARDKAGLSTHASAIDLGKLADSFTKLHTFSVWLVERARANATGTSDIREIIYSPDGNIVLRWDRERGINSEPRTGEADATHLTHTHISFYRDSRSRDKVRIFAPYFEVDDLDITAIKGEDWNLAGGVRRPYRSKPERTNAAIAGYIEPTDTPIRTIAEVTANSNNWRTTKIGGKVIYLLRSDLTPVVPGGDPATDAALSSYIAREAPDCSAAVKAATAPLLTKIAAARSALS